MHIVACCLIFATWVSQSCVDCCCVYYLRAQTVAIKELSHSTLLNVTSWKVSHIFYRIFSYIFTIITVVVCNFRWVILKLYLFSQHQCHNFCVQYCCVYLILIAPTVAVWRIVAFHFDWYDHGTLPKFFICYVPSIFTTETVCIFYFLTLYRWELFNLAI